MSDAERILTAGSERERALLRAGIEEGPSEAGLRAAERVLGLVVGATVGTDQVPKPTAGPPIAGRFAAPGMIPLVPALVAGALTLGAIGATFYATSPRRAAISVPAPEAPPQAPPSPAPPVAVVGRDGEANGGPLPLGSGENGTRMQSSRAAPPRAREGLESEIAAVDLARAQAASGDWAGALRSLDDHDRRTPSGVLSEEADLIRLEAVIAQRDSAGAASLARRFLVRHPASVHSETVRSWLAQYRTREAGSPR